MKTYKCLKAIKKNSQTNDGHPDGTELLIFAEKTIDEEVKKQAEKDGIPIADKIYYALVKNSQNRYYIMAVEIEKMEDFYAYVNAEESQVVEWLDERG